MTMPIASLFGSAGLLGMVVARFLGTSAAVSNLLVASFVCLVLSPARAGASHYQLLD